MNKLPTSPEQAEDAVLNSRTEFANMWRAYRKAEGQDWSEDFKKLPAQHQVMIASLVPALGQIEIAVKVVGLKKNDFEKLLKKANESKAAKKFQYVYGLELRRYLLSVGASSEEEFKIIRSEFWDVYFKQKDCKDYKGASSTLTNIAKFGGHMTDGTQVTTTVSIDDIDRLKQKWAERNGSRK